MNAVDIKAHTWRYKTRLGAVMNGVCRKTYSICLHMWCTMHGGRSTHLSSTLTSIYYILNMHIPYSHLLSLLFIIYLACIYHTLIYSHFYLLYLTCRYCTATLTVLYLPPPMYLACMHTASLNVRLLLPNSVTYMPLQTTNSCFFLCISRQKNIFLAKLNTM